MKGLATKELGWLALPLLIVIIHAGWVLSKITVNAENQAKRPETEAFTMGERARSISDEQKAAFSVLMGVQPSSAAVSDKAESIDIRYITLAELQPKLLAVDEVSGIHTARLWLDNAKMRSADATGAQESDSTPLAEINPSLRLYSLAEGDQLFHYQVAELGLSHIRLVFSPTIEHDWQQEPELLLKLFEERKPEKDSDKPAARNRK
jgi:hypothetical protein